MGIAQTPNAEGKFRAALPQNPFIPPKGDGCFINKLPPELLSRIFEIGSADCRAEYQVDVTNGGCDALWQHLYGWDRAAERDIHDSGIEIQALVDANEGEEDDDDKEEEEETYDSDEDYDSNESTASSDPPPQAPWLPFPIVVSHVCRHWHNITISTPSLWTTLVVTPVDGLPYKPKSMLLKRSKNLPIDVYVCCQLDKYQIYSVPPDDDDLISILSIFTPHIERWHTMHLTVFGYHLMYAFLRAVTATPAPQLTTLELYHYEAEGHLQFGYSSTLKNLTLFAGSAPLLTRIVLWGVHVDWNQP